jgi:hypothetical protein
MDSETYAKQRQGHSIKFNQMKNITSQQLVDLRPTTWGMKAAVKPPAEPQTQQTDASRSSSISGSTRSMYGRQSSGTASQEPKKQLDRVKQVMDQSRSEASSQASSRETSLSRPGADSRESSVSRPQSGEVAQAAPKKKLTPEERERKIKNLTEEFIENDDLNVGIHFH